jgi:hypothetical protein
MDIQGFEAYALRGMKETLRRHKPTFLIEFWPWGIDQSGADPDDVLRTFAELGYLPHILTRSGTADLITYDSIQGRIPTGSEGARYINLIFRPQSV